MTIIYTQQINVNDDQVGVVCWHVQDGAEVEIGAELVDLETSKAVVTVDATARGRVRQIARLGDIVRVGAPICEILDGVEETASAEISPSPLPSLAMTSNSERIKESVKSPLRSEAALLPEVKVDPTLTVEGATRFSKRASRLMENLGLTTADFQGAGLVTEKLVRGRFERRVLQPLNDIPLPPSSLAAKQFVAPTLGLRSEPLSLSKRAEIEALQVGESGQINSTVSVYFDSASIRERLSREQKFDGNIQPIILYELSRMLRQWPQFTAYYDSDTVYYYERVDIGLAIDLGRGLKVVTIKNADNMMPIDLYERTVEIGINYIENKTRPSELVDSTITVTDLSSFDILNFKPLINGRQSVIIGLGGDSEQPGHPMCFSMTFDHRVSNGREAGMFLKEFRKRIQSYAPDGAVQLQSHASSPTRLSTIGAICCDRCGKDSESYYRENQDAYMAASFNATGELVATCRSCASGYT